MKALLYFALNLLLTTQSHASVLSVCRYITSGNTNVGASREPDIYAAKCVQLAKEKSLNEHDLKDSQCTSSVGSPFGAIPSHGYQCLVDIFGSATQSQATPVKSKDITCEIDIGSKEVHYQPAVTRYDDYNGVDYTLDNGIKVNVTTLLNFAGETPIIEVTYTVSKREKVIQSSTLEGLFRLRAWLNFTPESRGYFDCN